MKGLSREFSRKEKALLVVFVIILIGLCYYRFVHVPINEKIAAAEDRQLQLQDEEVILQAQVAQYQKMKDEIDSIKESGSIVSTMPSYNSSKLEIAFLNDVLQPAIDYDVSFTSLTREGNQIRRNFNLSYKTSEYETARSIIENLYACQYRLLIDDLVIAKNARTVTVASSRTGNGVKSTTTVVETTYSVSLSATFYETMVGGTADAGLPADSAASTDEE